MPVMRGLRRTKALCTGIVFAVGCFLSLGTPAQAKSDPVVQTAAPVEGFYNNNVAEFLGIPYAAPPVGKLRWNATQPHAPWTKTLKALAYGNTCAQITTLGVFAGPANNNEDCLFANIFTPNLQNTRTFR